MPGRKTANKPRLQKSGDGTKKLNEHTKHKHSGKGNCQRRRNVAGEVQDVNIGKYKNCEGRRARQKIVGSTKRRTKHFACSLLDLRVKLMSRLRRGRASSRREKKLTYLVHEFISPHLFSITKCHSGAGMPPKVAVAIARDVFPLAVTGCGPPGV